MAEFFSVVFQGFFSSNLYINIKGHWLSYISLLKSEVIQRRKSVIFVVECEHNFIVYYLHFFLWRELCSVVEMDLYVSLSLFLSLSPLFFFFFIKSGRVCNLKLETQQFLNRKKKGFLWNCMSLCVMVHLLTPFSLPVNFSCTHPVQKGFAS